MWIEKWERKMLSVFVRSCTPFQFVGTLGKKVCGKLNWDTATNILKMKNTDFFYYEVKNMSVYGGSNS